MLDSEPQNEIIESNENNINNEEKSTIVNTLYNHRIITDENMTNLPRKENTERIEKSTIRTDKKVKRKIVVRVTKPKSERIEEEDKININLKENKENQDDFDGISEEGSFVMVKKDGKFLKTKFKEVK